ncbi:MAG: hypothetical protein OJF52_002210 [Nitrospira sp.]|nr:MAG: hypothetical protein OJF52_002210 [Nitrospira sp.]
MQRSSTKTAESGARSVPSAPKQAAQASPLHSLETTSVSAWPDRSRCVSEADGRPSCSPAPLHPTFKLQRAIGNQAVGRLLRSRSIQAKPQISQPGDLYEQEADRAAERVVRGERVLSAPLTAVPSIQRDDVDSPSFDRQESVTPPPESGRLPADAGGLPTGKEPSASDKLKEAAQKTGEALRKTAAGKDLEEKATQLGKDFVSTLEGKVIAGTALGGALAGIIAADAELPTQLPDIPLDWLAPGLKGTLTYEGPVRHPTKVFLTLTFTPGSGQAKKQAHRESEQYRAETARIAADQEKFKRGLKYRPGSPQDVEAKEEEAAIQQWASSRLRIPQQTGDAALKPVLRLDSLAQDAWKVTWDNYFKARRQRRLGGEEFHLHPPTVSPISPPAPAEGEATPIMRKEETPRQPQIPLSLVEEVLRSPGRPLDRSTLAFMESRFGCDFSQVRVHTDAKAAESARTVEASAYTVGNDVVFGAGHYAPGTSAGRRLLSHELAHVVQQNTSVRLTQIQKESLSSPQDAAEGEAEAVAQHLSRSGIAPHVTSVPRRIQRDTGKGSAGSETPSFRVIDHGASPAAVKVAHERMAEILGALRPGNLAQIKGLTVELHLIPHDKKLTDLPEYASLKGTKTFDGRLYDDLRGAGGMRVGNTIRYAVAEEELIAIPSAQGSTGNVAGAVLGGLAGAALGAAIGSLGGPVGALVGGLLGGLAGAIAGAAIGKRKGTRKEGYGTGFVAGHETGHIVEQFALTKEQKIQLEKDYAERKKAGGPWLSPDWYTSSGSGEYFAQSTAAYFGRPYTETAADEAMYNREWLRKNDPAMYRLLTTVFK